MRYADKVVLKYIDKTPKHYDPDLGRMVGGKEWTKTTACNVTGVSLDLQAELGDLLNTNSIVVRFRSTISDGIDTIEYNGGKYKPVTVRSYLSGRNVIYANKVVR
ncbi:minor head protein [Streptococcus phage 01205]|uniref:ORF34 n=1 Tax=Streptococcus phage O1205 TaxID=85154 RepID=O34065_BPO12|nr:minor head protein [Streptococcus phage 01205]AAC79549.1 ORF34 [Streptococcus phage 01205]